MLQQTGNNVEVFGHAVAGQMERRAGISIKLTMPQFEIRNYMKKSAIELDIHPFYGKEVRNQKRFIKRVIYKIIPAHTFLPFLAELKLTWVRLKSFKERTRYTHAKNLLVNIGAGNQGKEGWINIDGRKQPGINCVYDCRKSLPFSDNSVRGIFCEHFFEHIDYTEEVPYFLSECYRVLMPGGVIRLIVPDIEKYIKGYCQEGWEDLIGLRPLSEEREDSFFKCKYNVKMELLNVVFRQGFQHKYGYDFDNLRFLLLKFGLSGVYL